MACPSLISGSSLVAHLTPMKRILCLCPIPTLVQPCDTDRSLSEFRIGVAISDPYLARAEIVNFQSSSSSSSVLEDQAWTIKWPQHENNYSESNRPNRENDRIQHSFPSLVKEFTDQIDHTDIGAIAFALPMKPSNANTTRWVNYASLNAHNHTATVKAIQQFMHITILKNYWEQDPRFAGNGLVCELNDPCTLAKARQMAKEEPDMWEDIPELVANDGDTKENIAPSVHAAVALNQFLWKHTCGWKNTFG